MPMICKTRARAESGWILLTLMLFVALIAISAAVIAPALAFQVKRDREEEMIHRAVQYSRAVRKYFKKFGRFPTRVEELENTNNLRFLRKRYKDPVTGKEFRLLHYTDVKFNFAAGVAGMNPAGVPTLGGVGNQANAQAAAAALGQVAALQAAQQNNPNPFANPNQTSPGSGSATTTGDGTGSEKPGSGDASKEGDSASSKSSPGSAGNPLSAQTFGGGPIVGVASTSENETIREFNKKHHYNDWQFIYDPGTDRGGLLNAPAQPPLAGAGQTIQNNPGATQGGQLFPGTGAGTNPGQGPPNPPAPPVQQPDSQ